MYQISCSAETTTLLPKGQVKDRRGTDDVPSRSEKERDELVDYTVLAGTQNAEMAGCGSKKIYWEMTREEGRERRKSQIRKG